MHVATPKLAFFFLYVNLLLQPESLAVILVPQRCGFGSQKCGQKGRWQRMAVLHPDLLIPEVTPNDP